jgi:hypothetical protein
MNPGSSLERKALRKGNTITRIATIKAAIFFFIDCEILIKPRQNYRAPEKIHMI